MMVKLQVRLMPFTSVGSRERDKKKSDQNLNPPLSCFFVFVFFTLCCEQQDLALIVFPLWGKLGQHYNQVP